ncbi:uncharacterized protein LOC117113594 isoform X2 [Anneissia japonica]|uniref:uncharacterized protein LOC117113594 isoform X2 n=1 Tax=Anneissia japonica TaxID=1529436 RepID=UPI00142592EF|nr:uncharacterized protein LOC117113594 isoform X2 [Anneissia japonica]
MTVWVNLQPTSSLRTSVDVTPKTTMLNTGGAYSSKFKALEKERFDKLRSTNQVEQVTVQDRARSLSLETNRRRRALELKKKLEAQKEARRRQEILDDRKQRQNEATQKYQRLKSATHRKTEDKVRGANHGLGRAYDLGLYTHPSNTGTNGTSRHTPGLDDALRAVRGSPGLAFKHHELEVTYPQSQSTSAQSNYPYYQSTMHSQLTNGHTQYVNQQGLSGISNPQPMNLNGRGVNYHGLPPSATSHNTSGYPGRDGATVKSIYEKQIEDQQRNIVEQSQKSLHEFNKAILNEAERPLRRSSSCSSVDSLEEQDNTKGIPVSKAYSTSVLPSSTHTSNFTSYRNGVNGTSTVTHTPYLGGFDYKSLNSSTKPVQNSEHSGLDQNTGGEIRLEETNEADVVQDQVDVNPRLLNSSSSAKNRMDHVLRNHASTKPYTTTRTAVAWASPQVEHSDKNSNTVVAPHLHPFSAKTTATLYTVEPPSNFQYKVDVASRASKPEHYVENAGTAPRSERTVAQVKISPETSHTVDQVVDAEAGSSKKVTQAPKSILKKGNVTAKNSAMTSQRYGNYTMSRLGGAKVVDSLELRKASSMSDISPSKKGIRWADLEYKRSDSDDDHYGPSNGQISAQIFNKKSADQADTSSRPTSAKVMSRNRVSTTQENRISSAGSINRSSVSRPRSSAIRQPVHSTSDKEPNNETNNVGANGNKSVASANGKAVYGPNGIRLDRTPTDDEINWLWDKVRTCLNVREEQGTTAPVPVAQKPPTGKPPSTSSQYADGKRPSAIRTKPPMPSALVPQSNNSTYPRRRTSSDTASSFLRRTALLQQRRQHAASLRGQNTRTSHHNEPMGSADVPSFTMNDRQKNGEEGPSTLSMEEQRLLESLDRLNERLRITTEATSHLSTTYAPFSHKVSTAGSGFRGHRPLSSTIRTATDIGHRKPHTRTLSADRASGRTYYR